MPNLEVHCRRTLKRYGAEGRDIHEWLDKPSRKYAGAHRQFRHDTETIKLVGEIFGKTYGKSLAENIALDHIMLDHEEEIKRNRKIVANLPEKRATSSIPCIYCNTLLKPNNQNCPKCGASRTKIIEEFDRKYEMEKLKLQARRRKLREELKIELELRELTPEERASLWVFNKSDPFPPHLTSITQRNKILEKLVQEDFSQNPQLKKQAYQEIAKREKSKKRRSDIISVAFILCLLWVVIPSLYLGMVHGVLIGFGWFFFWGVFSFTLLVAIASIFK